MLSHRRDEFQNRHSGEFEGRRSDAETFAASSRELEREGRLREGLTRRSVPRPTCSSSITPGEKLFAATARRNRRRRGHAPRRDLRRGVRSRTNSRRGWRKGKGVWKGRRGKALESKAAATAGGSDAAVTATERYAADSGRRFRLLLNPRRGEPLVLIPARNGCVCGSNSGLSREGSAPSASTRAAWDALGRARAREQG